MIRTRKTVFFVFAAFMGILIIALYETTTLLWSQRMVEAEAKNMEWLRRHLTLSLGLEVTRIRRALALLVANPQNLTRQFLRTIEVDYGMVVEPADTGARVTTVVQLGDDPPGATKSLAREAVAKFGKLPAASGSSVCRFLKTDDGKLFLLAAAKLPSSPDRYVIVAEQWDIGTLGRLAGRPLSSAVFQLSHRRRGPTGDFKAPRFIEDAGLRVADDCYSWTVLLLLPDAPTALKADVSFRSALALSIDRAKMWSAFLFLAFAALALVVFTGTLDRWVFNPLQRLSGAVTAIYSSGDFDRRLPEPDKSELAQISRELNTLLDTISESRAALIEGEVRYRSLVETAGDGILVVQKGRICYVNPAFCRLVGEDTSRVFSKPARDYFELPREALQEEQGLKSAPERFILYEATVRAEKSQRISVEINQGTFKFKDQAAFLLVVRDLSIRKQLETTLRIERERLRLIMDSVSESIIAADASDRIVFVNPAACRFFSLGPNELIGHSLPDVFRAVHGDDIPAEFTGTMNVALRTGRPVALRQVHISPKGGEKRVVDGALLPLKRDDGSVAGAMVILRDITEELFIQKRLQDFEKMESLNYLASGIAHDFNNIITAIVNNIGLAMLCGGNTAQAVDPLKKAEEACQQGRRLARQLLDFLKQRPSTRERLRIDRVVRECADYILHGSNVQYRISVAGEIEPVEADLGRISQVFSNLIINARQAMGDGGRLLLELTCIESTDPTENQTIPKRFVRVRVTDSGPGIPNDRLPRVFQPYFTTKTDGTGLGLAITKSIVEEHGGRILVDSEVGRGTTFSVFLPVAEASGKEDGAAGAPLPHLMSVRGKKVLFVDDNPAIGQVVTQVLEAFGCDVAWAEDAATALGLFRRRKDEGAPFDVIVTDLNLGGGVPARPLPEGSSKRCRTCRLLPPAAIIPIQSSKTTGVSALPVLSLNRSQLMSSLICYTGFEPPHSFLAAAMGTTSFAHILSTERAERSRAPRAPGEE
ncbi:MAG: PAS domain S-box protein [Kiritimatiellaeota bacterium]|nr:PAS domain S-box protein [Kiritimatiellota bacterium]